MSDENKNKPIDVKNLLAVAEDHELEFVAGIKDRHDKRQEQFEEFRKSTRITNEFLNRRYTI